jgi:hypothetical protein
MANKKFIVNAPDGTDITVIAPEDATDERLIELAKSQVQQKALGADVARKGGLVARAIAPYAAGAATGAAIGAPFAGIGAIPGALIGAGMVGLGKTVGDIGAMGASAITGKNIPGPTALIEPALSKIGFPEPQTPAERMLYTGVETAAGALTPAGAARTIAPKVAPSATRSLLEAVGTKPIAQAAVGAGGATGTQGLLEAGVEPAIAIPAGVAATFAAGHKFASPTPERVLASQVKGAADEAFSVARDSPLTVNGDEFRRVLDTAATEARKEGFRPDLQSSVFKAIDLIKEEAGDAPEVTLKSIDEWRRVLQQAGKSNPGAGALFNDVRADLDALVTKEVPDDPFKVARQQWATGSKLEAIENAAERARISGGAKSLQNELKSLLKNKKQMRFFTEEERAKIEEATKGGVPARAVALVGEMFPRWASVISGGAGIYTGNIPEAAAALILPEVSRAMAARATQRRVEGLLGQIGGAPQTPTRAGQAAIRGLPAATVGSGLLEMGAYPEKR